VAFLQVSHPDTHKYPTHLMWLLKRLLSLERLMLDYMAEGSYECCQPVLSLFTTFGESHSRLMIDWTTSSQVRMVLYLFLWWWGGGQALYN
jgi:hypothetical protein